MSLDPFAKARRNAHRDTADTLEIQRIIRLPIVELPSPEEVEAFCREEVQARYFDDGFRLFATQVGAVIAWDLYQGLFAPIGVGWGKTLITLMIANRAFERGESSRSIIFVPPNVYLQLTTTDIAWARKRVGLSVPFILMAGRSASSRKAAAESGKRGCYIMPYSYLSTRDAEAMLHAISPDLVILDEAHNVKNEEAARTKRLLRYMDQKQPKLVALSGTMTSKTIRDYHHLIARSLNENCPLPMDPALALNWSYVLDADADPNDGQTGPIAPLLAWSQRNFPKEKLPKGVPGFRKAYKIRLNTCPGVVSTGDAEIGVSLTIENEDYSTKEALGDDDPSFQKLEQLMTDVEELWRTPSGDEIEYGFHKWRHLYELTSGFYYHLRWPTVPELIRRSRISDAEAEAYLTAAQEHHLARQEYNKKLRRWLEHNGRPHLDTPLLVGNSMHLHGARDVGAELYAVWKEAKDLEFDGMPERLSEPIRVCDYKIRHIVNWAKTRKGEGSLIWFHHDMFGRWIDEALAAAGVEAVWCPSESVRAGSNALMIEAGKGKGPHANKAIIASMGGHGTGKNLQHFKHQLFAQFPRKADLLEQVLGRTHRNGQDADELIANTMNENEFDHQNTAAALVDSLYIHQTLGSRQKAIYANWNPLPKMYPDDFLRERGFMDVSKLDASARAALEDKFGPLEKRK